MNEKIKKAFDQIQAEDELKNKTKDFILNKTNGYNQKPKKTRYWRLVPIAICMLFAFVGGYWLYFTPTVEISMDVNPSIELSVNRFDRVISVTGYNDDGQELIESLDIKHMNYNDAIDKILNSQDIIELLSNNEVMTICVIGKDGKQSTRIFSNIESSTAKTENTYCYHAQMEEVEEAHDGAHSFLPQEHLSPDSALLPVHTNLLGIRARGHREIRRRQGRLAGGQAPVALPPAALWRARVLRPRAIIAARTARTRVRDNSPRS